MAAGKNARRFAWAGLTVVLVAGVFTGLWAQSPPARGGGEGLGAVSLGSAVPEAIPPKAESGAQPVLGQEHNVPFFARSENDFGRANPKLPLKHIILTLKRSPAQQEALDQLLAEQQDPSSPNYHRWLTPEEFGMRFGPSCEALDRISKWLQSQGFTIDEVAKGRMWINFSGTVADVERAFHTEIHNYLVGEKFYYANATAPRIPSELAGVVAGIVSLNNHPLQPMHTPPVQVTLQGPQPDFTNNGNHYLAPGDFATIYNVKPLYNASPAIDGTGVTIAIVGRTHPTNFLTIVNLFRSLFSLPYNPPTVTVNGTDPGDIGSGEDTEAELDVEWSGAVAKNATINFVISQSGASDGVALSAQYVVNNNLAPVMSTSFGLCESSLGSGGNAFYNNLWLQAAAQGITAFVSSGDAGCCGCSSPSTSTCSTGQAVSGLSSTPYNVCVGGNEFLDSSNPTAYWNTTNAADFSSAKSYIPEEAWNESGTVSGGSALWSTGGGVSTLYAKPFWQAAPGVPTDGQRHVPDVSLTAAQHDGYMVQTTTTSGSVSIVGGTSASSPAFAGLMALVVQKTGQRQGNANFRFYQLGKAQYTNGTPVVFHDVTTLDNSVPGQAGFSCGTGYDQSTGLGSVDANALVNNWGQLIANADTGWQQNLTNTSGALGSSVLAKFWQVGNAAGADSGTINQGSLASAYSTGYRVYTNWSTAGVVGAPPSSGARTAVLYSDVNGGSARFLIMSTGPSVGQYDFDAITNGSSNAGGCTGTGNAPCSVSIPNVIAGTRAPNDANGKDYTVSWTPLSNLEGYYDTDPGSNLITGIAVYYWNGAAAPTANATGYGISNANWVLAAGGTNPARTGYVSWGSSGSDPGTLTVYIPSSAPATTYVALDVLFDNWTPGTATFPTRTDFVGAATAFAGPTPAGVFASFNASLHHGVVKVSWRSNVETGVASYTVYASGHKHRNFRPVDSTSTVPQGDNHLYALNFPYPKSIHRRVLFLKVAALRMDGTTTWSQRVKVKKR
jgi:hypothetical protein